MSGLVGVCVPPDYLLALPTRLCDRPSPLRRLAIRDFDMVGPNWARISSESMSPVRERVRPRGAILTVRSDKLTVSSKAEGFQTKLTTQLAP